MTVTAVRWFDDVLLTGSYDRTVKLWEFANGRASCYKTLHHDTKVLVMARSNFEQNVLATGTRSIGLWNMKESEYTPLGINKHRSRKDIKLVPTSLAWGTVPSTKDILVAGMSEKDDGVSQNGLLAAWQVREGGATPLQLSPNSQNIFDIRWHPSSEAFVTGSSTGQKKNGSVVRQYEPLKSKTRIYEFDCPAMDINDVTFCPINSNYVTANCTDGNTYVWDYRKHNDFILKLPHGDPLNQTDERLTREQADVGVTVALWGNAIDQFYTGASDGILKRWNILRSSEDALVEDTHSFKEEIARAAFSDDKSNLLVGDAAGGIHVLSPGPFSNTDDLSFTFKRAPQLPFDHHEPDSESGVKAARKLLSSGQLVQHPVFGAGQGPRYSGPFATWARPEGTPFDQIAKTQLKRELQIRQLDWIPVQSRDVLDEQSRREVEAQIQLARIRNQRQNEYKRKRAEPSNTKALASFDDNFIDLCSDEDAKPCPSAVFHSGFKRRAKTQSCGSLVIDVQPEIIDLTGDTDTEEFADPSTDAQLQGVTRCPEPNKVPLRGGDTLLQELEEELDEDFWWPSSRYVDPNIQDVTV
ncbi:hypothetical protein EYZ11_010876 [Aspergillus tanneri]|uniref:Uncharacterized protein n=1 Tax=Aspergillus tanneri TaxID=1220188 RepID=A0A4S3J489_9EURO|nr:hypothetical protein EYZ11_010876 [Aspergillus tanneri]